MRVTQIYNKNSDKKTIGNNIDKKKPISIGRFCFLIVILPAIVFILVFLLMYLPNLWANIPGPYAILTVRVIQRYMLYGAYGIIFITGLVGLIYAYIRARKDWRYYSLALLLSGLLIVWTLFGFAQQYIYQNNSEYKRYKNNLAMCEGLYYELLSSAYLPSQDPKYVDVNKDKFNMQDLDVRYNALYDPTGPLWENNGICTEDHMSEKEANQLQAYYSQHLNLRAELALAANNSAARSLATSIREMEIEGKTEEACGFTINAKMVNQMLPISSIDRNGVCKVKWVNQNDGTEMSTKELLDTL